MAKKAKKKKTPAAKPKPKAAAKKAAKVEAPPLPGSRLLNFKVLNSEYETMKRLAKKHAGGNLSAWVRFATVNAKPTPQQQKRFDTGGY